MQPTEVSKETLKENEEQPMQQQVGQVQKKVKPSGKLWVLLICLISIAYGIILVYEIVFTKYYFVLVGLQFQEDAKVFGDLFQQAIPGCYNFILGIFICGIASIMYVVFNVFFALFALCGINKLVMIVQGIICAVSAFAAFYFNREVCEGTFWEVTKIYVEELNNFPESTQMHYLGISGLSFLSVIAGLSWNRNKKKAQIKIQSEKEEISQETLKKKND